MLNRYLLRLLSGIRSFQRVFMWGMIFVAAAVAAQGQVVTRETINQRVDLKSLPQAKKTLLTDLVAKTVKPLNLAVDPKSGSVISMQGQIAVSPQGTAPDVVTRTFLSKYAGLYGLKNLSTLTFLKPLKVGDIQQITAQQQYKGLPVFSAGIVVDVNPSGQVVSTCGQTVPVANLPTRSTVTNAQAIAALRRELNLPADYPVVPKLGVLDPNLVPGKSSQQQLAWQFVLDTPEGQQQVFVNNATGPVAMVLSIPAEINTGTTGNPCSQTVVPQYHTNPASGVPDFVTFGPGGLLFPESASGVAANVAMAFFSHYPLVFGTGDVPNQLKVISTQTDSQAPHLTHVVLQQMYGGTPVFGAELRVHMTPSLAITTISGNYVRDPQVLLMPIFSQQQALNAAAGPIADWRYQHSTQLPLPGTPNFPFLNNPLRLSNAFQQRQQILNNVLSQAQSKGLVVYPAVLNGRATSKNDLAYWFEFPEAKVFVSAISGQPISAISNRSFTDRVIYDARKAGEISVPSPVIRNGTLIPGGITPNPDAVAADPFVLSTLGFYSGVGRSSYDNHDSQVNIVTNSVFTLSPCPNAFWDGFRNEAWFCLGMMTDDILAHEFTHGVTATTAGLLPIDESGALNEHYSDVMAAVITQNTPAGPWVLGEGSVAACPATLTRPSNIRVMSNPALSCPAQPTNYANYIPRPVTCLGLLGPITDPTCDQGNVHGNDGIGNLAAFLISDGASGAGRSALGRARLGRLFHDTLTTRLHPWANYIDERNNTWDVARGLAANGAITQPSFDVTHVNQVSWAFTQVGVDQRLISGWSSVGGGLTGGRGTLTFYPGESLSGGSTVTDVELRVVARAGNYAYWEGRSRVLCATGAPAACIPGGAVTFPNTVGASPIFGATIATQGIGTASETTTVNYFHTGFLSFEIEVNIISTTPTGPPVIQSTQFESVTSTKAHWGGLGGKGDDSINTGVTVAGSADCVVDNVKVDALDKDDNVVVSAGKGAAASGSTSWPTWGSEITADGKGTNSTAVTVHWWYDLGVATRYRIHYFLSSASGGTCSAS